VPARLADKARAVRSDFRIVHFSVQGDHLHLIVEAKDKRALSNGVRGLAVSLARRLNALISARGRVFTDRWFGRALTTARAVRRVLVYVLFNFHKHGRVVAGGVDPFSSAPYFAGFRELSGRVPIERNAGLVPRALAPPDAGNPPIAPPATELLESGWRRLGAISLRERPRTQSVEATPARS